MTMSVWNGHENLKLGADSTKVDDGEHLLTVDTARLHQSSNPESMGQIFFIVEGIVRESTVHRPGERRSISLNLSKYGKPEAKQVIAICLGKKFEDLTQKELDDSTSALQTLRGRSFVVVAKNTEKKKTKGEYFQKLTFRAPDNGNPTASPLPADAAILAEITAPPPPPPAPAADPGPRFQDVNGVWWYKHPGVPGSYYDANQNIVELSKIRR